MGSQPIIMNLMASSIKLADSAGKIIRDIMEGGDLGTIEKGIDDPQTEADRKSQRVIIASLSKLFPRVKVVGEEGATDLNVPDEWLIKDLDESFLLQQCPESLQNVKDEDIVVWVDPLDGTSEYTQGFLEHVTVLIGIAVNKQAVGGVIHQPYYKQSDDTIGRTIWGLKGLGTGGFTVKTIGSDKLIVTTTRSHSNAIVEAALAALNPTEVIKVGGAGYKVLQLLEGKANAYVFASAGMKRWDTCAPEAILEASSGVLTDILGEHYSYSADVDYVNRRGVLATAAGVSHEQLVKTIPDMVKEAMTKK